MAKFIKRCFAHLYKSHASLHFRSVYDFFLLRYVTVSQTVGSNDEGTTQHALPFSSFAVSKQCVCIGNLLKTEKVMLFLF